jgi:hypothetical protein
MEVLPIAGQFLGHAVKGIPKRSLFRSVRYPG